MIMDTSCYPNQPGAHHGATDTSAKAAKSVSEIDSPLRRACREMLAAHGPMTADEIATRLGESVLTIRPRIAQLKALNRVIDTGDRRKNESGRSAAVWKLVSTQAIQQELI